MIITDNSCESLAYNHEKFENSIPTITNLLSTSTIRQLQDKGLLIFTDQKRGLSLNKRIIDKRGRDYFTNNFMGFIQLIDDSHSEQLTIRSRFSGSEEYDNDYFLLYMISKVFDIPNIVGFFKGFSDNHPILKLSTFIFSYYLNKAISNGLFKVYTSKFYNDDHFRGVLNVQRYFKSNVPYLGKISYITQERTNNNYLTQLVRHTIEHIRTLSSSETMLHTSDEAIASIVKCTSNYQSRDRNKIITANILHPLTNRYYKDWFLLQKICLYILNDRKHNFNNRCDIPTKGIFFDGAWLWEEYIHKLTTQYFTHPNNYIKSHTEYLFTNFSNGKLQQPIYPDFIHTNYPYIIADAKYKPIEQSNRQDYYQLLSYMFRFNSNIGLLIYPHPAKSFQDHPNNYKTRLLLNTGFGAQARLSNYDLTSDSVFVEKIPILIPITQDFTTFCNQIKVSEHFLTSTLENHLSI